MTAALVLRPEPGNAATAARLAGLGIAARCYPFFAVRPLDWAVPDALVFDALLITSANAVRHVGVGLAALSHLPVLAVGAATATAAHAVGLKVALTGTSDAAALVATAIMHGWQRPLHLTGRDHRSLPGIAAIEVYASEPLPIDAASVATWRRHVALLHSARAAARFAELIAAADLPRADIGIAALSYAVAAAAGGKWGAVAIAAAPTDAALVTAAAALIDPTRSAADKLRR